MERTASVPIISKGKFICGDSCYYATINSLSSIQDATLPDLTYILDNGKAVGVFARELFPGAVTVERSSLYKQAINTHLLINEGTEYICEASFFKNNLFCAIDILKVTQPGHVEIYEVKSSTKIKDIFYRDIAFQAHIVGLSGYTVDATYLIYVNSEYVRGDKLDPHQYFIIENVSNDVFSLLPTIEGDIKTIRDTMASNGKINPPISKCCFRPYMCPYWEKVCKPTLPKNSIFEISGGMHISTKLKHYSNGICTMRDFLKLKKQNPKYVQQCRLEVNKDDRNEINKEELNSFLKKIRFPIISLDFETLIEAMQLFPGQKAYDQTVFQFSLHVLRNIGEKLEHYEYLADPETDWRSDLAHALVKHCPPIGTILVWNESMEKNRILEFAELECNADIRDDLLNMADRILDLMVPFRNRVVYNRRMYGRYSVKKVLPALCPDDENLSYENLAINNGLLASMAFSQMVHNPNMPILETAIVRRALLTYCELDTYGPFCILDVMCKLLDPESPNLFEKTNRVDKTQRAIHMGDRVTTNIGNGKVVGFTRCFVRVQLDKSNLTIIRMPHNLYNITGMVLPKIRHKKIPYVLGGISKFYDASHRIARLGDFVVTKASLGQVVGRTNCFLRILLNDGAEVRRKGTFVIIE